MVGIDGLGYMGLATALGFASNGWKVVGYDVNESIRGLINARKSPFHEKGFPSLIQTHVRSGRLRMMESLEQLSVEADGIFICLPTPPTEDGRVDLGVIRQGSADLARALRDVAKYRTVVVKSTVVPGTTTGVIEPILRAASRKEASMLGIAVNPEFLSEGTAIQDASKPQRIIIGVSDRRSAQWLRRVYAPFKAPICELPPAGAELAKYASNAFLSIKVSFTNEISRLTERLGVDIDDVMYAVGKDTRIGKKFLSAGPGFGGSCFEKDVRALIAQAEEFGIRLRLGRAALQANEEQAAHVIDLIRHSVGALRGKRVTILGVAFKTGTDDVRGSRAFPIIQVVLRAGAKVRVHDPVAIDNFKREWEQWRKFESDSPTFCATVEEALDNADIAVLHTDWPLYARWRRTWSQRMRRRVLLDLRRLVSPASARASGIKVYSLGVGSE